MTFPALSATMQASIEPVDNFLPMLFLMAILGILVMLVMIGICLGELAAKFDIVMGFTPGDM
jgi:hypothetical protein